MSRARPVLRLCSNRLTRMWPDHFHAVGRKRRHCILGRLRSEFEHVFEATRRIHEQKARGSRFNSERVGNASRKRHEGAHLSKMIFASDMEGHFTFQHIEPFIFVPMNVEGVARWPCGCRFELLSQAR